MQILPPGRKVRVCALLKGAKSKGMMFTSYLFSLSNITCMILVLKVNFQTVRVSKLYCGMVFSDSYFILSTEKVEIFWSVWTFPYCTVVLDRYKVYSLE